MTDIYEDIKAERAYQDRKWGGKPGVDRVDINYTDVLVEEVGEASKAKLEHGMVSQEVRKELIQVAAVAVAEIEQIDNLLKNE